MKRLFAALIAPLLLAPILLAATPAPTASAQADSEASEVTELVIASKNFTENRLLGEILRILIEEETDLEVTHRASLGGTKVCWDALRAGQVDLYVDYTGTGWAIILQKEGAPGEPLPVFLTVQRDYRERYDVEWLAPFGLNNTYAMALRDEVAEELGATRISDLIGHGAQLNTGFSVEFMNREDGWPGLREAYAGLDLEPRSMEHGLAYEALARGELDLIDAYSTDGKLARYSVTVLEDDLGFFPPYNAAPLLRGEIARARPDLVRVIEQLAFTIDDAKALELNARIEVGKESFEKVAYDFLREAGLIGASETRATAGADRSGGFMTTLWGQRDRLLGFVLEHILLVFVSVLIAAAIAIPLGVHITRHPQLSRLFLGATSVMQTIPSLALLAFLIAIPWLGLGTLSAIVALVLYALLPILRNTHSGLTTVDPELVAVAHGLGLTPRQVLVRIQLPIAMRTILAGLRTATVISVGVATLAAFIGAGGLGQPIIEGLYLNDTQLVLVGAVPAALLALAADGLLGVVERKVTPRGLRGAD